MEATLRAVVLTVPYGSSSFPMATSGLRKIMPLSTDSLAEKWNSLAPESLAISAILLSLMPHPGIIIIRLPALLTSSANNEAPSSAVGLHPEVSMRAHPSPMMSSNA